MPINLPDNVGAMTEQQKLNLYADLYRAGNSDADIRAAADAKYGKQSDADWDYLRMNAPTQSIQPIEPPVGSGSASSNGLTADIARDLMQRSMTTGAPTAEFNKYGGYDAVRSVYNANGGSYDPSTFDSGFRTRAAQTIAETGVGNLSLLRDTNTPLTMAGVAAMRNNGIDSDFINRAVNDYGVDGFVTNNQFSGLQGRYDTLNTNYGKLQEQLAALQASYNSLRRTSNSTSSTGSSAGSGGVVGDTGTTVDSGGAPAGGSSSTDTTMGAVYGPDGTMYSSPAAARAAGVFNYTRVRPVRTNNPATTQTANPNVNASPIGFGGGLINNVVQGDPMTYFTDNAQVGLPAGVRAAF